MYDKDYANKKDSYENLCLKRHEDWVVTSISYSYAWAAAKALPFQAS